MKTKHQHRDIQVTQGALNFSKGPKGSAAGQPFTFFIGRVKARHSDRCSCDVETSDGQTLYNVPMLTKAGVINGAPYGEVDLPEVDDYVVVGPVGQGPRKKAIFGMHTNDPTICGPRPAGPATTKMSGVRPDWLPKR